MTNTLPPATATSPGMPMPRIAILILNWNGKQDTLECLASVYRIDYPAFDVVVVDNGSADDSVQAIRHSYPQAVILETGANLGFAGGNNVGIRWALEQGFDGILLLNNDTVVDPGLLAAFAGAERRFPGAGVFGAKIYYYSPEDVLWFAGGLWQSKSLSFTHVGIGKLDGPEYAEPRAYDYITGCALYASAEVFRAIGLLDEAFFLTYEETDWCYRARARGYQCLYIPEAKLWHKVSVSCGGAASPLVNYFMTRNKLLWAKKHLPMKARWQLHRQTWRKLRRILLPPFILMEEDVSLQRRILWAVASWRKDLAENLANRMHRTTLLAVRDHYLGRYGDCPAAVRVLVKRPNIESSP